MSRQRESILSKLTDSQRSAALERERDVIVHAGAGSGKTRTLVARYLSLLDDGLVPSQIAAITFTEKAAREMKTRVRNELKRIADSVEEPLARDHWLELLNQMDGARIGTIHSLCSQILRLHPAEAVLDPNFSILDEGQTALVISDIVDSMIAKIADQDEYLPLLTTLDTENIRKVFTFLLQNRQDAEPYLSIDTSLPDFIRKEVLRFLNQPLVQNLLSEYAAVSFQELTDLAGDFVAEKMKSLIEAFKNAQEDCQDGKDGFACYAEIREPYNDWNFAKGKRTVWKADCMNVREYKGSFFKWMEKTTGKAYCDGQEQADYDKMTACCRKAFPELVSQYKNALTERNALDFDGLEENTLAVLQQKDVLTKWTTMIQAVLVDEFQDTNARQTRLVHMLADCPGKLFVVGDDKQSIYRFRRADVSVFAQTAKEIRAQGGLEIELNETWRAHQKLMEGMGTILETGMNEPDLAGEPFYVPYAALYSQRETPVEMEEPFIEYLISQIEDKEPDSGVQKEWWQQNLGSEDARRAAVQLLCARLMELKNLGKFFSWNDVVLLFRASTGFRYYEDEFEKAGIPYITVAGKGFYDRPEIRDVLNMLRAIANPMDDTALTGFLLSPAMGFSLDMMAWLRGCLDEAGEILPLWLALCSELQMPDAEQQKLREQTVQKLEELTLLAGRVSIDELLERLYAITNYRTVLAKENSERLWRNLDKLQRDARLSGQTVVSEFLGYINNINIAGAREGEAPSDRSAAVRLMTIHKAKGLEFPIVVLADAGYSGNRAGPDILLSDVFGLCVKSDPLSLKYEYARINDSRQEEAELARLFYVAVTRAENRLIINGHIKKSKSGLSGKSRKSKFINMIPEAAEQTEQSEDEHIRIIGENTPVYYELKTEVDESVDRYAEKVPDKAEPWKGRSLLEPLIPAATGVPVTEEADEEKRFGLSVGTMVHKALELWLFPEEEAFQSVVRQMQLYQTDLSEELRKKALERVVMLLKRFRDSALFEEIQQADFCRHEIPFSLPVKGYTVNGIIDLLIRKGGQWKVIDFKTDAISSRAELELLLPTYGQQITQYGKAVNRMLQTNASQALCFLDYCGEVHIEGDGGGGTHTDKYQS